MNELDAKVAELKKQLKSLTSKRVSERTEDDKVRIAEIRLAIADCKTQIGKLKLVEARAKAAEAKDRAMLRNLHEAGIVTENGVKALLKLRDVCHEFGVSDVVKLRNILSSINSQGK